MDLAHLCFESPLEELVETEVQQPTLVATSLAILAAVRKAGIEPDVVVGHSVGEFAALASVGAMSDGEAIGLVRERGLAMAEAARERPGAMAAILGLEDQLVETLCRKILGVWPANYNCPGQIVVSGENDAVEECCAEAESLGARRAIRLKVSGAFHSPLVGQAGTRAQAGDRPDPLHRPRQAVHVDRDGEDRAGAAARRAARRPADGARPLHAGGRRADARRRHDLRRDRAGQRPLRARQAHRPRRADVLGQRPREPREGQGGARAPRELVRVARGEARPRHRRLTGYRARDRARARPRRGRGRRRLPHRPRGGGGRRRGDRRPRGRGRRLGRRSPRRRSSRRRATSTSSSTTPA